MSRALVVLWPFPVRSLWLVSCLLSCLPAQSAVLRVDADAPGPGRNGASWDTAYTNLKDAFSAARSGDEVWVAEGVYPPPAANVPSGVAVFGGFQGVEETREERDPHRRLTIIRRTQTTSVYSLLSFPSSCGPDTVIDGFTLVAAPDSAGYGVYAAGAPTVRNNFIHGIASSAGVTCPENSAPTIAGNTISSNGGSGVVALSGSRPVITGNIITDNSTESYNGSLSRGYGGGIYCRDAMPVIRNNRILGNRSTYAGGGIYVYGNADIRNNVVAGNSRGGIWINRPSSMEFNTIFGNAIGPGIALVLGSIGGHVVRNNIVAFNESGVSSDIPMASIQFRNNCVYGNAVADYVSHMTDATGRDGNIKADPRLDGRAFGDPHIAPSSPCRNAAALPADGTDIDGQARVLDGAPDIGADESDGTHPTYAHTVLRVAPSGSDTGDGRTWATALKSVQGAIDALLPTGGEVWVAEGAYRERITLRSFVYLFGGFRGDETERDERDFAAHRTVLDGEWLGTTVRAHGGHRDSAVDSFTIRRGVLGVYASGASPAKISGEPLS